MSDSKPNATTTSLDGYVVKSLPESVHYIPNFISTVEESQLLHEIHSQPKPKWTILKHRRLQTHPSSLTASNVLLAASLPAWLSSLVPRMQALGIWDSSPHKAPNHVLINEYNPGEGIMPHEDGGAYYGCVATVSLGAPIVLDIYEKVEGGIRLPKWRILQEPRSLLVTKDSMYNSHLHGIQATTSDEEINSITIANWELLGDKEAFSEGRYDREVRTSLTYRDVLRVSNVGSRLFGRK